MSETPEKITANGRYVNNNDWLECRQAWVHSFHSKIHSLMFPQTSTFDGKQGTPRYQAEVLLPASYMSGIIANEVQPMLAKKKITLDQLVGEFWLPPAVGTPQGRKLKSAEVPSYMQQAVRVGFPALRYGQKLAQVDSRWAEFANYVIMRITRYVGQGAPEVFVVDQRENSWRRLDPNNPTDMQIYMTTFVSGMSIDFSYKTFLVDNHLMFSISKVYAQTGRVPQVMAPGFVGSAVADPTEAPAIAHTTAA